MAGKGHERVALIGNPNVGKSAIFGLLTGTYATVSNYPGTTVEVFQTNISLDGRKYLVVDTPGVNSLIPMSEDERVTRDILLEERPASVIQVGDAKNLRRTLLLTIQLAEMGLPVILDLNMEDEARDRGISINAEALRDVLGVPVVGTIAVEKKGIRELRAAISGRGGGAAVPALAVHYGDLIEQYITKVSAVLPAAGITQRSLALMVLSGDESLRKWLNANLSPDGVAELEGLRAECQSGLKGQSIGMTIGEARMGLAGAIAGGVITRSAQTGGRAAAFIGRVSMHPLWGLPLLLLVLLGLYEFVGVFGAGTLVGFLEKTVFGEYLNPMFAKVVDMLLPVGFLREMLVGQYGLITMALTYAIAIILPITTTFFIVFSILEDSGYLPRLAIMSNRIFNLMGLSGKAVLPMVLGLGCGTMAVMTTRVLETRKDRVIATFLLALAVPCSAQLGVILGMLGALSARATAIWAGSVLAVLFVAGFLASKIVSGERSEFFLEIPPLRVPSIGNIAAKTSSRAVWYLKEAVPLFMLGTFSLFVLDKMGILSVIERFASPVITGILGLPSKATEAFLIGFFRRDYGAAGLYAMAEKGLLTPVQSVVSLVTITLFVPCLAHFFMMIKERGLRMAVGMMALIVPLAIASGGILNWILRALNINI